MPNVNACGLCNSLKAIYLCYILGKYERFMEYILKLLQRVYIYNPHESVLLGTMKLLFKMNH